MHLWLGREAGAQLLSGYKSVERQRKASGEALLHEIHVHLFIHRILNNKKETGGKLSLAMVSGKSDLMSLREIFTARHKWDELFKMDESKKGRIFSGRKETFKHTKQNMVEGSKELLGILGKRWLNDPERGTRDC